MTDRTRSVHSTADPFVRGFQDDASMLSAFIPLGDWQVVKMWRRERNGWTTRLAVILLAFEMLLLGFATGAVADVMPRDQFGNVICSSSVMETVSDTSEGSGQHAGKLDCCTLSCPMFGAAFAPAPTVVSSLIRRPIMRAVPFVLYEDVGSRAVETPRKTRGPPLPI